MDPFAVLGIDRCFAIDLEGLEKRHRELSRALHPDRFIGAGPSERRAALSKAVQVNEAWRIVRDPIRRAEALLAPMGLDVSEGARRGRAADPEFLMNMMEQREALAGARQRRDLARVRAMAESIGARMLHVEQSLAAGFATGTSPLSGDQAAALADKVDEMRFYRRFLDEVSAIEDELAA